MHLHLKETDGEGLSILRLVVEGLQPGEACKNCGLAISMFVVVVVRLRHNDVMDSTGSESSTWTQRWLYLAAAAAGSQVAS